MKYSEILEDVLDGKWVKACKSHRWQRLREDGLWDMYPPAKVPEGCVEHECIINEKEGEPKPMSPHFMRQDNWEVRPDDIHVWGVCDSDGISCIFEAEPVKNGGRWQDMVSEVGKNLFSKDKPQKFKLVPVEE